MSWEISGMIPYNPLQRSTHLGLTANELMEAMANIVDGHCDGVDAFSLPLILLELGEYYREKGIGNAASMSATWQGGIAGGW